MIAFKFPKPGYCSDDPRAPHGYDRDASLNSGQYVCICKSWVPVDVDVPTLQMTNDVLREQVKTLEEELAVTNKILNNVYEAAGVPIFSSRPLAAYISDMTETINKQKAEIDQLNKQVTNRSAWICSMIAALDRAIIFCKILQRHEDKWWKILFPRNKYMKDVKDIISAAEKAIKYRK